MIDHRQVEGKLPFFRPPALSGHWIAASATQDSPLLARTVQKKRLSVVQRQPIELLYFAQFEVQCKRCGPACRRAGNDDSELVRVA